MLFDRPDPAATTKSHTSLLPPRAGRLLRYIAIVALISASTAVMMFCPCDSVGLRDYHAISLVALAFSLGAAAAYLVYRRMRRDSGVTGFLRAFIAIIIVGFGVYLELFVAMEVVAWLARPR